MKRLFAISVLLSFVLVASYAQSLDSLPRAFSDKKLSGNMDNNYLAFKGNLDFSKVLTDPAEKKDQLLMFYQRSSSGMEGLVISSPIDNMPVMKPTGNFPNRNFLPDPTHHYPIRNYKPHFTHTVTLDK